MELLDLYKLLLLPKELEYCYQISKYPTNADTDRMYPLMQIRHFQSMKQHDDSQHILKDSKSQKAPLALINNEQAHQLIGFVILSYSHSLVGI